MIAQGAFQGLSQQVLVDTILYLRVVAMYSRSKKVMYGLGTLLIVCTLASLTVILDVGRKSEGVTLQLQA